MLLLVRGLAAAAGYRLGACFLGRAPLYTAGPLLNSSPPWGCGSRLITSAKGQGYRRLSMATQAQNKVCSVKDVVAAMATIAPLNLAEKWDNVGLLVEPFETRAVTTVFLTNDLTEPVLEEAISLRANFIISYHPPIFVPLKSLTTATFKERVILRAVESRIAVYSPHTALDAVVGGVNDWLASGLGSRRVKPLSFKEVVPVKYDSLVSIKGFTNAGELEAFSETLHSEIEGGIQRCDGLIDSSDCALAINCGRKCVPEFLALSCLQPHLSVEVKPFSCVDKAVGSPVVAGGGRLVVLDGSLSLKDLISRVKTHLGLQHVRIALGSGVGMETEVETVAICAGSGASVLQDVKADVYWTGEMSHHQVLGANAAGTSVILCEHSNTERGYLPTLRQSLLSCLKEKDVEVFLSQVDRDPLQTA